MPFIEIHLTRGLSDGRKRRLIQDVVSVTHDAIGSDPKIINVVLHEHPEANLSVSGRVGGEAARPGPTPDGP